MNRDRILKTCLSAIKHGCQAALALTSQREKGYRLYYSGRPTAHWSKSALNAWFQVDVIVALFSRQLTSRRDSSAIHSEADRSVGRAVPTWGVFAPFRRANAIELIDQMPVNGSFRVSSR